MYFLACATQAVLGSEWSSEDDYEDEAQSSGAGLPGESKDKENQQQLNHTKASKHSQLVPLNNAMGISLSVSPKDKKLAQAT